MRIVAGAWRGRALVAPPGQGTRPTADRVRQALFDMLMHAAWGGRAVIEGAVVLDAFAGTGALGLEALSRGASSACFIESDAAALRALRANVAACNAGDRTQILTVDALAIGPTVTVGRPPTEGVASRSVTVRARMAGSGPARTQRPSSAMTIRDEEGVTTATGTVFQTSLGHSAPATLVFLDPPYGQDLIPCAVTRLRDVGRIGPDALIVAETGCDETWKPEPPLLLAERQYGAARIIVFRSV
jgi:16S rRNA G966 N2-methylase RsmD